MTTPPTRPVARPLHQRLADAFVAGSAALDALAEATPVDRRDEVLTLAAIHDLHLAPLDEVGPVAARWQHHPAVATLKGQLEQRLIARIEAAASALPAAGPAGARAAGALVGRGADPVGALQALAALDRVPAVYDWLASRASLAELRWFLAVEGGPDGGFDDLVAICQVGLSGEPKVELATNFWDEMGRGDLGAVHTELHRLLSRSLSLAPPPRAEAPVPVLVRTLVGSMLATNRVRQPEMVGALGLIELQAGPRCRQVVAALRRLGAPAGALPFYEEHAVADPRHGRAWLDRVVAPLASDPAWAEGIVRGARWRAAANRQFHRWADTARRAGVGDLSGALAVAG